MITRKQVEAFWNGRAEPPSELEWQIHLIEEQVRGRFKKGQKIEVVFSSEKIWHPTIQGPYPGGKDLSPEDLFQIQIRGIYDLHKGQVRYAYAAQLALRHLNGIISPTFRVPEKPTWWVFPW